MPRYFFDVTETGKVSIDDEGLELASLQDARREALQALGGIARDELPDGDRRQFVIEIREGDGGPLLRASLSLRVEQITN
jgi:hypothetical protein